MTDAPKRYLPLYEAKMMHQFTHRWATYERSGKTRDMTEAELADPDALPLPRYWVDERDVEARLEKWGRGWLLGFRNITNTTNERTGIFGLIPLAGVGNSTPLIRFQDDIAPELAACLSCNLSTFCLDYVTRMKLGGTNLNFFYVEQLPVIPPDWYTPDLIDYIAPRVLELTYTAWDLQPFARDLGYEGPPFPWDAERRFTLRCELDALYFHLYGIAREDVAYIMDTFPIVKRKDEAAHGEYRTKRVILELYDQSPRA